MKDETTRDAEGRDKDGLTFAEKAEHERWRREQEQRKEAKELAERLSRFVNTYSEVHWEYLIEALSHEHRTLQQSLTKLMLKWFRHLAELPEHWYDLRNEASVKTARKVRAALSEEHGERYWDHLPMI